MQARQLQPGDGVSNWVHPVNLSSALWAELGSRICSAGLASIIRVEERLPVEMSVAVTALESRV